MYTYLPYGASGLGDANQNVSLATAAAGIAAKSAIAAHLLPAAAAGPIGLAIAGVGLALTLIFSRRGPQQKIAATHIADQVAAELQKNLDGYRANPTPENQQAALANFDYAWSQLVAGCSDPSLGDAGRRCISERQQGGVAPWCPSADHRGCDWFILYRQPILDLPPVSDSFFSSEPTTGGATSFALPDFFGASATGFNFWPLAIAGLLAFSFAGDR